jgi:hypothetical protein
MFFHATKGKRKAFRIQPEKWRITFSFKLKELFTAKKPDGKFLLISDEKR